VSFQVNQSYAIIPPPKENVICDWFAEKAPSKNAAFLFNLLINGYNHGDSGFCYYGLAALRCRENEA